MTVNDAIPHFHVNDGALVKPGDLGWLEAVHQMNGARHRETSLT